MELVGLVILVQGSVAMLSGQYHSEKDFTKVEAIGKVKQTLLQHRLKNRTIF